MRQSISISVVIDHTW